MENSIITQSGSLTFQSEIQFDTLLALVRKLPKQRQLTLFNVLKKETMKERYLSLSEKMPDIESIEIEDIVNEVSKIRAERYAK